MSWCLMGGIGVAGDRGLAAVGLRDFSGCDSLGFAKTPREHVMAWTEITRAKYRRDGLRYASDTTDEELRHSHISLALRGRV
jgi:hypothetical protein